jgi:hypothetical protein
VSGASVVLGCAGWLGGQVADPGGGPQTLVKSCCQACCQGHPVGRCRVIRHAEDAVQAGTLMSLRADRRGCCSGKARSGDGGRGTGEVERAGGGEERVEASGLEQDLMHRPHGAVRGAARRGGLRSGIRRKISRPGTWLAFFCAANAVKGISATSAREIQVLVCSS